MNIKSITIFIIVAIAVASCKKDVKVNPKINGIEPVQGTVNTLIKVTGSGLQNINSAVLDLDNVEILVNSNFNTSTAILLRVPANANAGKQHIVFTNSSGYQYSLPFVVY